MSTWLKKKYCCLLIPYVSFGSHCLYFLMYSFKRQSFIQRIFVEYPFVPGTELHELNMQMNNILLSALQEVRIS